MDFRPVFAFFFWIFLVDVLLLGWLGSKPAEHPYVLLSQLLTFFYFSYFLIFLPFTSRLERFFWFD
jgi:ubiquinol-cytochrome c reductase cytochrome b subunit